MYSTSECSCQSQSSSSALHVHMDCSSSSCSCTSMCSCPSCTSTSATNSTQLRHSNQDRTCWSRTARASASSHSHSHSASASVHTDRDSSLVSESTLYSDCTQCNTEQGAVSLLHFGPTGDCSHTASNTESSTKKSSTDSSEPGNGNVHRKKLMRVNSAELYVLRQQLTDNVQHLVQLVHTERMVGTNYSTSTLINTQTRSLWQVTHARMTRTGALTRLGVAQTRAVLQGAVLGLGWLHAQQVAHTNLTLHHLLLDAHVGVRLCGLSHARYTNQHNHTHAHTHIPTTPTDMQYLSVEHLQQLLSADDQRHKQNTTDTDTEAHSPAKRSRLTTHSRPRPQQASGTDWCATDMYALGVCVHVLLHAKWPTPMYNHVLQNIVAKQQMVVHMRSHQNTQHANQDTYEATRLIGRLLSAVQHRPSAPQLATDPWLQETPAATSLYMNPLHTRIPRS